MQSSLHLLFPLCSSILFVIGATFAKRANVLGAGPIAVTFFANLALAACWMIVGCVRQDWLPLSDCWPALWIACTFFGGQLCTFLAFRLGDVSLATPVFGVKIIMVAVISSILTQSGMDVRIGVAAAIATAGVVVIQLGSRSPSATQLTRRKATLSIVLALIAATSLSIFDLGVQFYGPKVGVLRLLTTMFAMVGILTIGLLPWMDRLRTLRKPSLTMNLSIAAAFMTVQAISITYSLAEFGDATRINIVYSLRGLWSVALAWGLSQIGISPEGTPNTSTILYRLSGATLLLISVLVALSAN